MNIVLFGSEHCSSCKKWKPTFERLMNEYQLDYKYVDIDKENNRQYALNGVPATVFYKDGKEIGRILGSMEEDIARKQIEYYLNV